MGRSLRVVGLARPGEVAFFSYLGSRTGLSSAFFDVPLEDKKEK